MFLEESPEQQQLRAELRSYYAELLTDDVRAGLAEGGEGGDAWREVVGRIGKDGWLGIGWPAEFGGQGRPATDQFIFFDETRRAGAPFPFVTINTVGPTIMRYGTDEQKSFFLPKILAGELNFAIGYTEPEAGTDLASLRTRAVRDGEEYVVNGAKIFTSGADQADYVWLATRTDPDVPKHKGISILCVPTTSPGFAWSIINTVGGLTTTQTFYDNVRVPVANRVGDENEGWRMITTQLNHERVGLAAWSGLAISLYEDVVTWAARQKTDDGKTLIDQGWVQMDLAKCHAELEAMWLLNWRMAVHVADGDLTAAESSSIKVFGTERIIEVTARVAGGGRCRRVSRAGLAGRAAAGPGRSDGPAGSDQHVRRWRERGATRDRGDGRARDDAGCTVSGAGVAGERLEELAPFPDHSAELAPLVGQVSGSPNLSPDAVNLPMIRHWVEAMDDHNPVYVSDAAAREAGYDQLIAPPAMLQAWIMRGLRASLLVEEARAAGAEQGTGPNDVMMGLLDDEGLTSVVATNCEQHYVRPLVVGDRVLARSTIESISDPKRTALGTGRFLTTRMDYVAVPDADVPPDDEVTPEVVQALFDAGDPVATMRFRILKFLPPDRTPPRPPRPRPALTQDNAFWFEGAQAHRLLIQRCVSCGTLRHPPLPACGSCGSLEWDTVESSGRGTLYSYVVVHYPQVPSFEYPLPIGLIELEEGTRLVANLVEVPREDIEVGMELRAEFVDFDEDLSLPVFVPAGAGSGAGSGGGA